MDRKQIAHLWANKSRTSGRASALYFIDDTIYSYGSHFPIARHYKGAVLFTRASYSVTTARHISLTRSACSHLDVFSVVNPHNDPSGKDVKAYANEIQAAKLACAKARNPESHLESLERHINEANEFCSRFGFKTRFAMPEGAELDTLKERARKASKREAEARKAKAAKLELENAVAIEEWLAGKRDSLPYSVSKVYLRVRLTLPDVADLTNPTKRIETLETSRGARVPLAEAEKAFRFIMLKRETGWHRNGETFRVGEFQLDAVNTQGIVAGCHRIDWAEIERFAKAQGWI